MDQLGIWAVVLATVSFTRLAEFGLSSCVTKFVADSNASGKHAKSLIIIDTSVTTVAITIAILSPVLYLGLQSVFPLFIDAAHIDAANEILPYAIASLWLSAISTVQFGGLDGHQKMVARAWLESAGAVTYVVLALVLLESLQLVGLAVAQVCQGVFLLIGSRLLLRRTETALQLLPKHWDFQTLKSMLNYGLHLQFSALAASLLDPLTKILLTAFSGVSAAGYFELASQVVEKSRSVLSGANRAVVPHVAHLYYSGNHDDLKKFYAENSDIIHICVTVGCTLLLSSSFWISTVLLGVVDNTFVTLLILCVLGWGLNSLAIPAFYLNLGTGHVRINTIATGSMALLNLTLGILLGGYFGSFGATAAYGLALAASGGILILLTNKAWGGGSKIMGLSRRQAPINIALIAALLFAVTGSGTSNSITFVQLSLFTVVLPGAVVAILVWLHPIRRNFI